MERIQIGGRPVVGFGVGAPWWVAPGAAPLYNRLFGGDITPNPAYRASNVPSHVDPNAPADTAIPDAPPACADLPKWSQAIAGCSNANVKLAPGSSSGTTAPSSWWTLPFGGGVDADGKRILNPIEWLQAHETAIAVGAAVVATALVGGVIYKIVRR